MEVDVRDERVFAVTVATDGAVPLVLHRPARPRGWLVWAHGGSWQHGSASAWTPVTARLARLSGWGGRLRRIPARTVVPVPLLSAHVLAALDWVEHHAAGLPVAVGGDSAGGTIAAITALARRDAGGRRIGCGDISVVTSCGGVAVASVNSHVTVSQTSYNQNYDYLMDSSRR